MVKTTLAIGASLRIKHAFGGPSVEPRFPGALSSQPIFAVRLMRVSQEKFDRLYRKIASFMQGPGGKIRGCTGASLFGSEEKSEILIVAEFRSRRHWCKAQWDARLGELLQEIVENSETLHFSLFSGDRFPARRRGSGHAAPKTLEA